MIINNYYKDVYEIRASQFELKVIAKYLKNFSDDCFNTAPLTKDDIEFRLLEDLKEFVK